MLVAHGTTEKNSDLVEENGYFEPNTYFLKLSPDRKLGLFGAAGFALREHPLAQTYLDLYCKQDLMMGMPLFKECLKNQAKKYCEEKKEDTSPGLIYVLDAPARVFEHHRGPRSVFVPAELFSIEKISTSNIDCIITLEENIAHFKEKYSHEVRSLEDDVPSNMALRLFFTAYYRFNRLILRKK